MASVVREKTATGIRYYVQLSPGEKETRDKIRLGRVTKKQAESAKIYIEDLLLNRKIGTVLSPATQQWLLRIPKSFRNRLEKLDLVDPCEAGKRYTVKKWVDLYIETRSKDKNTKPDTVRKLENVARRLLVFFKSEKLDEVTVYDAKAFKSYLRNEVELAENTARKHISISRQFFKAAIDKKVISENPFRGQSVTIRPNESRFFFITPEMACAVLDVCPDAEWRLIFGLARYGGLRCPSEVLRLKWEDVDFANERFIVHASKTEHHSNGGIRTVPMFSELKPLFQDAFEKAKEGSIYCIARYRDKKVNLRTQMKKIIVKAGLEPWPKTFQNLRSTRETELFKVTGGNVKAVCSWIGNTPAVAMQHYAQVTEADMREATKLTVISQAKKTVQNPVHTRADLPSIMSHESDIVGDVKACKYKSLRREFIGVRNCAKNAQMGQAGFEPA